MRFRSSSKGGKRASIMSQVLFIGLLIASGIFLLIRATFRPNLTETQKTIVDTLTQGGCSQRLAIFWLAVSMHETGNFTSKIFKLANNCFGMKPAKVRPNHQSGVIQKTLTSPSELDYAAYQSVRDSALDILDYMDYFDYPQDFQTIDLFLLYMKSKGYFEDSIVNYSTGVKFFLNKLT